MSLSNHINKSARKWLNGGLFESIESIYAHYAKKNKLYNQARQGRYNNTVYFFLFILFNVRFSILYKYYVNIHVMIFQSEMDLNIFRPW